LSLSVVFVAASACDQSRFETTTLTSPSPNQPAVETPQLPAKATDRDDRALDEGLSDALLELQNRFKCNRISGCAAHAHVVGFGWQATPHVQRQFARAKRKASWRSRLVLIVAELRDPASLPFLVKAARDRDDEVVAYAVYGLAVLDHRDALDTIKKWADAGRGMQFAMSRLSARWALAKWQEEGAAEAFEQELAARTRQMLASATVAWGLRLCAEAPSLVCAKQRRAAARHPGFLARREVISRLEAEPRKAEVETLVMLAADPIASIRRRAIATLVSLTGRADLQDGAAWRTWCDSGGCPARPADRQSKAPRPTAAP
jgi:hypothetical protein